MTQNLKYMITPLHSSYLSIQWNPNGVDRVVRITVPLSSGTSGPGIDPQFPHIQEPNDESTSAITWGHKFYPTSLWIGISPQPKGSPLANKKIIPFNGNIWNEQRFYYTANGPRNKLNKIQFRFEYNRLEFLFFFILQFSPKYRLIWKLYVSYLPIGKSLIHRSKIIICWCAFAAVYCIVG